MSSDDNEAWNWMIYKICGSMTVDCGCIYCIKEQRLGFGNAAALVRPIERERGCEVVFLLPCYRRNITILMFFK